MSPEPSRARAAARAAGAALRGAAPLRLLAATACAESGAFPGWCALLGRCEPEREVFVPSPPPLVYEPEPVESPEIAGGRLLLRSVGFAPGSDAIDPVSAVVLDVAAAEILDRTGIRIRIEGHSDASPGAEAALDLSLRRAEAVRRYLVRKGVAPQRLETRAIGAARPIAPGDSETDRARNRRVELVVL